MSKKKILFFVEAMGGGVFTYITNLANGLSEEFDVYVAYATRKQTPSNYKEYFNKNVHLIKVNDFTRQISFQDIKAFFEIRKICRLVKPDIIHLHSAKAGILGRWAFSGKKIPIFYTPHGYSFLMSNISPIKKKIYKAIEKVSAMRNCTTISCSSGENDETKKLTSRALYVDNGINIQNIDDIIKNSDIVEDDNKTIFTIGRISTQKNPQLFNEIAKRFPENQFVWIGDGELRNQLTSSNITVTGWKNVNETLKIAQKHRIFLLTSKWEGLPMSLLEAMYMKKICVVSNVIGNNNVITDKVNGYLCSSVNDYTDVIKEVLKGKTPSYIINNAYNDIINHFNSESMVKGYIDIYRNVLSEK